MNEKTEKSLMGFLKILDVKMSDVEFQFPKTRFGQGTDRKKAFQQYLDLSTELTQLEADLAAIEAIPKEYLKQAARQAWSTARNGIKESLYEALAVFLNDWKVGGVIATVLVSEAMWCKKDEKRVSNEQSPPRYFVHATLEDDLSPSVVFERITNGWESQFGDEVVLEEIGWLDGQIRTPNSSSTAEGLFLIVQSRPEMVQDLITWLHALGVYMVSAPPMLAITLPSEGLVRGNE